MNFPKKLLYRIKIEHSLNELKKRGLKIGKNVHIMSGVIIDPEHCWHIEIGDNVTLAPRVHILAHDASTKIFLNHTRVANVKIGNRVFVGTGSIILPNVTIGNDVVIGAGSVVSKNIPDNSVAVGVPAKVISSLDDYLAKATSRKNAENTFSEEHTLRNPNFSVQHRAELIEKCAAHQEIFVE